MTNNPTMKVSFQIDVATRGAQEGMLISTGIFSGPVNFSTTKGENDFSSPFWSNLPKMTANVEKGKQLLALDSVPSSSGANKAELYPISTSSMSNERQFDQSSTNLHLDNYDINKNNESDWNAQLESEAVSQKQASPKIRLNVFEENDGNQPLMPLQNPTSRHNCLLTRFDESGANCATPRISHQNPQNKSLLCDSTTRTTTLEVFRPKADGVDFFQLPKGPLSHAKDSVTIVPTRGSAYERAEKSETEFAGDPHRIRRMETIQQSSSAPSIGQQKTVQWGGVQFTNISDSSSAISTSTCSRPKSPASPMEMVQIQTPANPITSSILSPPQQTSTPMPTNDTSPSLPIITSPSVEITSPADHFVIVRRQQSDHSERSLLLSPDAEFVPALPPRRHARAEWPPPPRPPKRWLEGRRAFGLGENAIPPRPPKPEHLRRRNMKERSQSADSFHWPSEAEEAQMQHDKQMVQSGGYTRPTRSASSNEIFKLYQTRDCLGRLVCEW